MAKSAKYRITETLVRLFGGIQFSRYPLWVMFGNTKYKVRGREQRRILGLLEPGDVLLRRYDGYVNNLFIPGFWSHGALAVSGEEIVHATTHNVVREDVLTFFRTDHIALLRARGCTEDQRETAVERALNLEGSEYDFEFDSGKNDYVYCFELCWEAWAAVLGPQPPGRAVVADDLAHNPALEVLHDSREWRRANGHV